MSDIKSEIENVRVFVRVRPLSKKEQSEARLNIVKVDTKENLIVLAKNDCVEKCRPYKFDQVFPEDSTQMDLYRVIAAPIVEKILQGYNGTIFAYGQTGTGKTYTMAGNIAQPETKGITPNTFSHIFTQISNSSEEKSFVVTVTYLEIYNEEVRDLLSANPNKKLAIRERSDVGIYVKDLMGFTVDSVESITELLNRGNRNRVTRSTLMNDVSSRSHAIFTITIESRNRADNKTIVGKLNLVDLAGSERASRTQATGERLKEASNINLSLSVLGNVISALVDGKSTHIPYRNSKLTRLLQDSLGGNSKTAMIAMVSPCDLDYEESICTLRYAARVKQIQNYAHINIEQKGLIEGFEQEIADLQQKIMELSIQNEYQAKRKKEKVEVRNEESFKFKEELEKTEKEKTDLESKIATIQKKILVGGINLLEKAQEQQFEMKSSDEVLQNLNKTHQELQEKLEKKGAEKIDFKEKYTNLQEEGIALTKKIKKIQAFLNEFKEEYKDKEHEYQREMEALLDNNRLLIRENQLAALMINSYIPQEYMQKIEANLTWNMETQEFQMKGVAYTGNNMRKRQGRGTDYDVPFRHEIKPVYHKYAEKRREKRSLEKKTYSALQNYAK